MKENRGKGRMGLSHRLERLMLFRVLMVTLLLGSAIAINFNDASSFSDPSYVTIFALIIITYVATIIYSVLVRRVKDVRLLAYVQILGDVLLSGGLVYVTGGTQSIFAFLMYLTIINGSILMGRRAGLVAATASAVVFLVMLLMHLGHLPSPLALESLAPSGRSPIYNVVVNIAAFYLVGFLAGYLARRLEEQGSELERKQLDIRELQALNQNILSSITSGVLSLDQQERVLFLNNSAERLLGYQMELVYGRPAADALPELAEAIEALVKAEAHHPHAGANSVLWEGWLVPHGEPEAERAFISVSHSRLYDGDGQPYGHILVLQDLTLVHRMRSHVQRQDRLAAVGQLAAAIAHEIRNPLASISGSVEMLKMFIEAGEDEERLMNIVIREIDRLNGLISEFLEYTRSRRRSRVSISLHDIITETVELFRMDRRLAGEVQVHLEMEEKTRENILADVEGMRQVFWNLLRNAAEAMEGKGNIHIKVLAMEGSYLPDGRWGLERPLSPQGEHGGYRILVSDDGPGIPATVQAHIFEPFFTTKQEGTGLGLATIYRIVEDHDGVIAVDSSPRGATFQIDLPLQMQALGAVLASRASLGLEPASVDLSLDGADTGAFAEEAQALHWK
jgi:two-component system sensor histidine kinase PilS (NtrC family)